MPEYIEDFPQIRAYPLQSMTNTVLRITTGGMKIGLRVLKNNIFVFWNSHGRGHIQSIKRHRLPYPNGGFATRIKCPECGLVTTVLFFSKTHGRFVCRYCAGALKYSAWKAPGCTRVPKRVDAWFAWFGRKAARILQKEGGP